MPAITGKEQLSKAELIHTLPQIVTDTFKWLQLSQHPNGLLSSVLRPHDIPPGQNNCQVGELLLTGQFVNHPEFRKAFPELREPADKFHRQLIIGVLKATSHPTQMARFNAELKYREENNHFTLVGEAPAVRYYAPSGGIIQESGYNQPYHWGLTLSEGGKAIENDPSILDTPGFNIGETLATATGYKTRLNLARLNCFSFWDRYCWVSFSTIYSGWAGLQQINRVWDKIKLDSHKKGYPLPIEEAGIISTIRDLEPYVKNYAGDYTDPTNHPLPGDLASLAIVDGQLPYNQKQRIIQDVIELENEWGCCRWAGDCDEGSERSWTVGKSLLAAYYLKRAQERAAKDPEVSQQYLNEGITRIQKLVSITKKYGFPPQSFQRNPKTGDFEPDKRMMTWQASPLIVACSSAYNVLRASKETV